MGYDEFSVQDCFEQELNGEFHKSGKYFYYPECCINAYPLISSSENNSKEVLPFFKMIFSPGDLTDLYITLDCS